MAVEKGRAGRGGHGEAGVLVASPWRRQRRWINGSRQERVRCGGQGVASPGRSQRRCAEQGTQQQLWGAECWECVYIYKESPTLDRNCMCLGQVLPP